MTTERFVMAIVSPLAVGELFVRNGVLLAVVQAALPDDEQILWAEPPKTHYQPPCIHSWNGQAERRAHTVPLGVQASPGLPED
jgi:hypothetical protein